MKKLLGMIFVAICLMMVGCSDNTATTATTTTAPSTATTVYVTTEPSAPTETTQALPAPADAEVQVLGIGGLDPDVVTVRVGGTVRWTVADDRRHSLSGDNNIFRSGSLNPGDQFEHTFTEAGEYGYIDIPFGRRATVIVE